MTNKHHNKTLKKTENICFISDKTNAVCDFLYFKKTKKTFIPTIGRRRTARWNSNINLTGTDIIKKMHFP
jgi:hypothetical protein